MNLLFVLGGDRYLHVSYYTVVCRAHPRCPWADMELVK